MFYEVYEINGKKVYVVEEHQHVLEAWSEYRRDVNDPPILFSLDHHTDTNSAFLSFSRNSDSTTANSEIARDLVESINFRNQDSIIGAIEKLRNDEHIDAAINSNVINKAFLVTYMESHDLPPSLEEEQFSLRNYESYFASGELELDKPNRPFTYPESQLFVIGNMCSVGCNRIPHNDDCTIPHYNQAIESIFLEDKLIIMSEMCPGIINENRILMDYILDIDLDYFHTLQSVQPEDLHVFYELINNASIITIATEPRYVEAWRIFDPNINSEIIFEHVMSHINIATHSVEADN